MKWGYGEEGCALTLGGLMDMRDSSRNRTCECSLNYQKSAEAKLPNILELREGLNHLRRIIPLRTQHLRKQKHHPS